MHSELTEQPWTSLTPLILTSRAIANYRQVSCAPADITRYLVSKLSIRTQHQVMSAIAAAAQNPLLYFSTAVSMDRSASTSSFDSAKSSSSKAYACRSSSSSASSSTSTPSTELSSLPGTMATTHSSSSSYSPKASSASYFPDVASWARSTSPNSLVNLDEMVPSSQCTGKK